MAWQNKTSYRPIALTSHTGKIMEKTITNGCYMIDRKNDIIPANQGFGKGGCITDHLVKLARHINSFQGEEVFWPHSFMLKRLDYKLKNIAITDVMFRLDYKLKNIAITDVMFHYIKNFFSERCICT